MNSQTFDLHTSLERISTATHYDALWETAVDCFSQAGADLIIYYHVSPPHAADAGRIDNLMHGYPRAWTKLYLSEGLEASDPLLGTAYMIINPIRWSDAIKNPNLNAKQKKFISTLTEWMKGDGYIFPAFGPSGRNGYMGIGNSASIQDWTADHIHKLNMIVQALHVRYSILRIQELPSKFTLEEDEHELLKNIARRLSTKGIASRLGVENDKVKLSIDMLMLKMGVSDIPSLIVRGESLGLIK